MSMDESHPGGMRPVVPKGAPPAKEGRKVGDTWWYNGKQLKWTGTQWTSSFEPVENVDPVPAAISVHGPNAVHEAVNHPKHYNSHPSGIECIEIVRHHNFNTGNAIKYLWRNGLKDGNTSIQDLRKAIWYLKDEIDRLDKPSVERKK